MVSLKWDVVEDDFSSSGRGRLPWSSLIAEGKDEADYLEMAGDGNHSFRGFQNT